MATIQARRINVTGVVQGVGFRPFVYQLAHNYGLTGWVCNTSGDVTIKVEGESKNIDQFLTRLRNGPPQSHIESIATTEVNPEGYQKFEILASLVKENEYQLISPDLATCPDCQKEIFDPSNRRYHYPFTNCTNCGPRFTIIQDIPYDRPRTTMKNFIMCPDCQKEYDNPENRRFHAQPNACPKCGPQLELTDTGGNVIPVPDVIAYAGRLLKEGHILAIKGLGGFLLTCDATNSDAVHGLRTRKLRPAKPFAIMLRDLEAVKKLCQVSIQELQALTSPASPIVLLRIKQGSLLSPEVAPGLKYLGVMLPYTPLHHLLLQETGLPLVMTSGNLSEEPIAKDNVEALARLNSIADYFILHNRDIYSRYDDSVTVVEQDEVRIVRRARGYAPYPIHLSFHLRPTLACGAELKNTFCLIRDQHAFVSQHIGDMENTETLEHFENTLNLYRKLFHVQPEIIACDLHPDYLPTQWAENEARNKHLPLVPVQHHHAHIASCMADNEVQEPVIGVAFDGTGYGTDGHIWGGEFLIADFHGFQRKAHFEYLPLPGANTAIRRPYRIAAGYIYSLLGSETLRLDLPGFRDVDQFEIDIIQKQVDQALNTPLTSSCGRLFDAVASLAGICQKVEYEGQAAIELEMAVAEKPTHGTYPFHLEVVNGVTIIRIKDILGGIISDIQQGVEIGTIAGLFHSTIAMIILQLSLQLSEETGIKQVALSGGVFQNRCLLGQVVAGLKDEGLVPLIHIHVPCNDGGISLGQAVIANFAQERSN